ncbi:uncharacterized protein LOC119278314 [Triticum dicoccoides]|uniref:Phospholipid/glycerol acyltransferase domain-containing protein n=1 Tax=Triticum turgidum subsp. durum TaxID=4567 RepID=A0A9R1S8G4_TRITD|nr:uncharacterized protein LOC119278314 [Triticum dicoccoides]VAH84156.1 unnamed protein product [Triticum turgidum subsp. durum]
MANPSMAAGGGVPWAEGARAVGAQIRNRLRVAPVDRRWLWRRPEGRAASEAVRQWSDRLRAILQRDKQNQGPDQQQGPGSPDASAAAAAKPSYSAFKFYRKKVGKEVNGVEDSVIFRSLQALAVPLIGNACHVFMHGLNSVQIYGAEKLQQALQERPKDKPLLTVSNHVAAMDDPFVIASLLPPSVMLEAQKLRWTLCATDRCFTNPVLSTFFRSVKVLPVNRGEGIYQKGMDMALSKLNNGGWVHIFPEGSRSRDGGKTIAPAKRGVGRLIMDADSLPVVVPFVHTGMQDIMPVGKRIPRTGKRVIVVVGDPINFDDLMAENSNDSQHISRGDLYDKVTERIGQRLQQLKVEVDRLAAEQKAELQNRHVANDTVNDGYKVWQQVDWESFGIGNMLSSAEHSSAQEPPPKQIQHEVLLAEQSASPAKQAEPEPRLEEEQSVFSPISRVPHWFSRRTDASELMGFAARGLVGNGRSMQEGYRQFQEPSVFSAWWEAQTSSAMMPRWSTA